MASALDPASTGTASIPVPMIPSVNSQSSQWVASRVGVAWIVAEVPRRFFLMMNTANMVADMSGRA